MLEGSETHIAHNACRARNAYMSPRRAPHTRTTSHHPSFNRSLYVQYATQMENVRSGDFIEFLAGETSGETSDFSYESLGYVILYDEDQPSSAAGGLSSEFKSVLGPNQWWPWWAWLLVALGLLLLCPCVICIYMHRSRHSDPPSPSGSGREGFSGGKFGSRHGGSGSGSDKGGGNGEVGKDNYPEFSKDFSEKEFDDATGVSVRFLFFAGGGEGGVSACM